MCINENEVVNTCITFVPVPNQGLISESDNMKAYDIRSTIQKPHDSLAVWKTIDNLTLAQCSFVIGSQSFPFK